MNTTSKPRLNLRDLNVWIWHGIAMAFRWCSDGHGGREVSIEVESAYVSEPDEFLAEHLGVPASFECAEQLVMDHEDEIRAEIEAALPKRLRDDYDPA
ncbi:MAG TPA: hypothetical protein VFB71_02910 [Ramlibacter sp.]|nr:hypothetical protein [Ramlibacter sp.]